MERRRMRRMGSSSNTKASAAAAAPAPKVVAVLAGLLERAAARGDADADTEDGRGAAAATAFRGRARPEISVRRYAERIYRYAGCSPPCFVVARVYLDRLAGRLEAEEEGESSSSSPAAAAACVVDSYSVHRLLITSVMVAAKFMDDIHYNNAYFARVGGVEVAEMNGLELELLFALRFRLNVTPATFAAYCAVLEGEMVAADGPLSPPMSSPSLSPEEEEEKIQASRRKDGGANNVAAAGRPAMLTAAHHRVVVEITQ